MIPVHAKAFHPMRGHVDDGTVVLFSSGEQLIVRPATRGWRLVGASTEHGPFDSAAALTAAVVALEDAQSTKQADKGGDTK